ncbi:hypothetical protein AK812_SmicGene26858 [Symbiodinium microadriaticum]|uniref:SH3 domain-containing protein n=1 Tax=Symbiodinium microadriaticum TaxID=2951 RepID=A0A1Q9D8D2_SYMMI|nr:hypothetical protein AK812_SmicGene26858 [Symbiodinium microadriaticum]
MFVCLAESRVPEEVLPRMVGSMRRKYKKEPTPSFDAVSRMGMAASLVVAGKVLWTLAADSDLVETQLGSSALRFEEGDLLQVEAKVDAAWLYGHAAKVTGQRKQVIRQGSEVKAKSSYQPEDALEDSKGIGWLYGRTLKAPSEFGFFPETCLERELPSVGPGFGLRWAAAGRRRDGFLDARRTSFRARQSSRAKCAKPTAREASQADADAEAPGQIEVATPQDKLPFDADIVNNDEEIPTKATQAAKAAVIGVDLLKDYGECRLANTKNAWHSKLSRASTLARSVGLGTPCIDRWVLAGLQDLVKAHQIEDSQAVSLAPQVAARPAGLFEETSEVLLERTSKKSKRKRKENSVNKWRRAIPEGIDSISANVGYSGARQSYQDRADAVLGAALDQLSEVVSNDALVNTKWPRRSQDPSSTPAGKGEDIEEAGSRESPSALFTRRLSTVRCVPRNVDGELAEMLDSDGFELLWQQDNTRMEVKRDPSCRVFEYRLAIRPKEVDISVIDLEQPLSQAAAHRDVAECLVSPVPLAAVGSLSAGSEAAVPARENSGQRISLAKGESTSFNCCQVYMMCFNIAVLRIEELFRYRDETNGFILEGIRTEFDQTALDATRPKSPKFTGPKSCDIASAGPSEVLARHPAVEHHSESLEAA